jgi:DNA repair exonuclease SbcCD ATPase subunit
VSSLARAERPHDHELEGLRARLAELEASLIERSTDAAKAQADLAAFRVRYRTEVGLLHDELDRLELAIAEAELEELTGRVASAARPDAAPVPPPSQPRYTTDAVRKLFRDVAKAIHPDLARDEIARDRRHSLMIEANRAYAMGDEEQLRAILQAWDRSPEAVQGTDADATRMRLVRRIAQIEEQLEGLASALAEVKESPLWQLKAMVDEEAATGKDLVADMVRRLKRDILVAINRLDALRGP